MAAEYVLKEGNPHVLLCERGIRTFETAYRFTLDLTAIPVLKELTHLPVVVDPSHAAGRRALVEPLSLAAAAAGRRRHHRRGAPEPGRGGLRRPAGARRRRLRRVRRARSRRPRRSRARSLSVARLTVRARDRRRRADRRLDRPGRARARRRARHRARPGTACSTPRSRAARWTPRQPAQAGGRRRRRGRSWPRPVGRSPQAVAVRARRRRVRTPSSPTSARPSARVAEAVARPALHRRPPARGRGDRRRRARPRGPLRRRHLVPDADRDHRGRRLRAAAPPARRPRRAPAGARRRRRTTGDGRGQPPAARAGQRARRPGRPRAGRRGRAAARRPGRASATPPASPARRPRSGATSTSPTPTRSATCSTTRSPGSAARARRRCADARRGRRSPPGTSSAGDERRRLLEAHLDRRRACVRLRVSVPNRPGRRGRGRARARARGSVNIVDMALHPTADNAAGVIELWVAAATQADDAARPDRPALRAAGGPRMKRFFRAGARGCAGTVVAPPDKSISHRAALLGGDVVRARVRHQLPARGGHALDPATPSRRSARSPRSATTAS